MDMNKAKQALEDLKAWAKKYDAEISEPRLKVVFTENDGEELHFIIYGGIDASMDVDEIGRQAYDSWDEI